MSQRIYKLKLDESRLCEGRKLFEEASIEDAKRQVPQDLPKDACNRVIR